MQIKNNYEKNVFNGDIGRITAVDSEEKNLLINFDGLDVEYDISELDEVVLAYATTIHKSQGSEFFHTAVVLPDAGGDLLTRELVYTGITRAKEFLTVVEPRPGLLGSAMAQQVRRASGLAFK